MSNLNDFWGSARDRLSSGKKRFRLPKFKFSSDFSQRWRSAIKAFRKFLKRILRLPKVLNRADKIALLILAIILLGLLGYKFDRDWLAKSKKVPATGGSYKEVLIGEARYLNPVLAKSDTDKTIDRLLYCGLSKIDNSGQLVPDLAKNWEITPDGRTYTFHLKSEVKWHDGAEFTSSDVAVTIEAIKNQNIKSPYFEAWKDVVVETPDKETVKFSLKDPYGPFIYNTLVGIIPAHVDPSSISSSPIGTGPYRFSKVISGKNSKIKEVILKRNEIYYGEKPYIEEVSFQIVEDENGAQKMLDSWGVTAVAGIKVSKKGVANYTFPTSRYFGFVFNLRDDKFKDINIRKKISALAKASLDGKAGEKFEPEFEFQLLVLDKPLPLAQAEEIKNNFSQFGAVVNIDKKNAIDYQNALDKRTFQTVLYGFDSGYDRDPYEFWHSSQVALGLNFSGFSEKAADILLEDARMTVDSGVRNQKYDQFFAILADKVPVIFYPNQEFHLAVKNGVLGVETLKGSEPQDHLNSFAGWYIKTKRVKP